LNDPHEVTPLFASLTEAAKKPFFKVEEEGWGEFDLGVTLHYAEKEGQKELTHDLNFQDSRYESPHKLVSFTYSGG
jgi:transcription initiation factor TFIID/TFIIF subunit